MPGIFQAFHIILTTASEVEQSPFPTWPTTGQTRRLQAFLSNHSRPHGEWTEQGAGTGLGSLQGPHFITQQTE